MKASDASTRPSGEHAAYQLRFESLFQQGRALAFPCDDHGQVAMDELSERALENYLYARAVVGHEYSLPHVVPSIGH